MILVGIDDTDMPDTPGTNQLAKRLAVVLSDLARCRRIVRHQLCGDPSIPCTSQNGSASLRFEPQPAFDADRMTQIIRETMREWYVSGSDPGLCIAWKEVPASVTEFGQKAKREIVTQAEARQIARDAGLFLEGLGGTEGGVIGALSAVGLAVTGEDGRLIQWDGWGDDLRGIVPLDEIVARGVIVRDERGEPVNAGRVDLVKKLRPNCRGGAMVLTVRPCGEPEAEWTAVKQL